jgi:phosphoenolpyruvate-protein phosphotransferase (PTS system enzyme I)
MAELRLTGRRASGGFARGPIAQLAVSAGDVRHIGEPPEESKALRDAMVIAIEQLSALADRADEEGAEILVFQIAMLEDEALAGAAFAAITGGVSAHQGWRNALDAEIAGYEAAADDHFRARAIDLRDIRDRVLGVLSGVASQAPPPRGAIVLAEDITPSGFLAIDWSEGGGLALMRGSASGHVATLARARGIPMVVGIDLDVRALRAPGEALIDGESGTLFIAPTLETRQDFVARAAAADRAAIAADSYRVAPAITRDGVRIQVCLNIADPTEIEALDPTSCDGVGLVRTEFLFHGREGLPEEETQYRAYRRLAEWACGKPVTIRTLDAGADKPIPGLTLEGETNPFLGLRGVRLSLAKPEPFRTQLRALCRAAAHGAIEVMLPMVTVSAELLEARRILEEEFETLQARHATCRMPPLGVMVEVPAAAIAVDLLDAAFFSIGSNDLTQYVMAAARDCEALAALSDASHPAVLRLIARVAAHGSAIGRKVSLCGDAGGEPRFIRALLSTGLRSLSVAPAALARTKQAIAELDLSTEAL